MLYSSVKVMGITKSMAERRGKTMEKKPLWVIDMAYLPTFNKFIMVTASREVCFFDGTTTELHARVSDGLKCKCVCVCVQFR